MHADELAEWVSSLKIEGIDAASVAKAKELILDHLGVILSGAAEEDSARAALDYAEALGGEPRCTLFRRGSRRVPCEAAAFAHATAGHSIEMDDIHNASSLHPGVATIPAALAAAEEFDRSGAELLEAILAGYEVVLRIGEAAVPSAVYKRGFHPTAICGVFSSAAAAGKLMGLTPEQMTRAFGLAWGFAAGNMSFQAEGSWAKRLQVGNMARAGIQAARLAALGATGPRHVLESHGFFHSYSGAFDSDKLTASLGGALKIMEVGLKPFACCRYNQMPVDGLLELRAEHEIKHEEIERIEIDIPSTGLPLVALPPDVKQRPADSVEAQFSLHYSSAVALVAGAAGREQYREPWLSDPRVLGLARRVQAGSSSEIDAKFPEKWATRVEIFVRGGRRFAYASDDCLGDPGKPLTYRRIVEKFTTLTAGNLGREGREAVASAVRDLESLPRAALLSEKILGGLI